MMNNPAESAASLHDEANELYWNSNETVEQIASRLGMSRNAIYASVQPLPAPGICPSCNTPLVYTNRSGRTAQRGTCLGCETEVHLGTGEAQRAPGAADLLAEVPAHEVPRPGEGGAIEQLKETLTNVDAERAALIGGAAVIGVAVGAAAVKAVRRKS